MCIVKNIRNYFQDGVLPAEGTVCKGDVYPFDDVDEAARLNAVGEDGEMWDAMVGLMKTMDSGPMARL
jgi:hypothetical protein